MEKGAATAADIELVKGPIGSLEITIGGRLVFSKLESGAFPTDHDIDALV